MFDDNCYQSKTLTNATNIFVKHVILENGITTEYFLNINILTTHNILLKMLTFRYFKLHVL